MFINKKFNVPVRIASIKHLSTACPSSVFASHAKPKGSYQGVIAGETGSRLRVHIDINYQVVNWGVWLPICSPRDILNRYGIGDSTSNVNCSNPGVIEMIFIKSPTWSGRGIL